MRPRPEMEKRTRVKSLILPFQCYEDRPDRLDGPENGTLEKALVRFSTALCMDFDIFIVVQSSKQLYTKIPLIFETSEDGLSVADFFAKY